MRYGRRRVHRAAARTSPLGLFVSFLKVGLTGFGKGLAVIAQVRELVVRERRWLSEREFAETDRSTKLVTAASLVRTGAELLRETILACVGGRRWDSG